MGGIADYSGATVLEATIGARTTVMVQPREDGLIRVLTVGPEAGPLDGATFELPTATFWRHDTPSTHGTLVAPEDLRNTIGKEHRWASYVVGVWYILISEGIAPSLPGANVIVHGTVPLGAGVASSAALEVATMRGSRQPSALTSTGSASPHFANSSNIVLPVRHAGSWTKSRAHWHSPGVY
jgi:galactokinase